MLAGKVAGSPGAARNSARWSKLRRRGMITVIAVILVFSVATARLFIWPEQGMPPRVNAIVMLNGDDSPLSVTLRLAREGRAKFVLVSQGTRSSNFGCPGRLPQVKIICF